MSRAAIRQIVSLRFISSFFASTRSVQRLACSGGGKIARSINSLIFSSGIGLRLPADVVKQDVNTLLEETVPPPPDSQLRHAVGPHRLRQGEAVTEVKDYGCPQDVLEDRMRIGLESLKKLPASFAQNDLCSPALCHSGSPERLHVHGRHSSSHNTMPFLSAVLSILRFGLASLFPNFIPAAMSFGLWGYLVGQVGLSASVVCAVAWHSASWLTIPSIS
jgi:hypothetical protein